MSTLRHYIASFLPSRMKREIKELYFSTLILEFGILMIQLFEPIYLFTLGYNLQSIILYFLFVYGLYFFLMPFGAYYAKRFGYEHGIILSTFIFVLYYIAFYFIQSYPVLFFIAPLLYALQKTFYWPAYHADFARYAVAREDSREVSGINVLTALAAIIAPLASGLILKFFGFGALFACASALFIISNIPLLTTKETFTPKPFIKYSQVFRNVFSKENRRAFLGYFAYGEELIVMVVWPVFMAVIIRDLLNIGVIVAIATFATMLVTLYIGRTADMKNKRHVLRFGTIVYAFVWLARLLVTKTLGILFIDTFSRISKNIIGIPLIALTYERARSKSVMQTVVFFEMSLIIGKLAALILLFALLFVIPEMLVYQTAFVVAGFMSLFYLLI